VAAQGNGMYITTSMFRKRLYTAYKRHNWMKQANRIYDEIQTRSMKKHTVTASAEYITNYYMIKMNKTRSIYFSSLPQAIMLHQQNPLA
jgi:hypothetical protein